VFVKETFLNSWYNIYLYNISEYMYRKFNLHAMVWRNLHRCVWLTTCACVSCLRARVHIMMQIVCRSADLYNVNKYLCLFFQQINFMSRCILFSYVLTLGKDLYKIILLHTRKYMKIFAIRDIYICIDIQSFRFSFPVFISQEHNTRITLSLRMHSLQEYLTCCA
jgi:hypothetical protein